MHLCIYKRSTNRIPQLEKKQEIRKYLQLYIKIQDYENTKVSSCIYKFSNFTELWPVQRIVIGIVTDI